MAEKPNIVVFMTDHQRGDTMKEGSPVKTPNIDRFRRQSVHFTRAYCPAPHCCPSRATFFSGLYPSEHGVWNNVNVGNTLSRGLFENTRLFSQDLQEAGYHLFFSGKWHVSDEQGPQDFGFELLYHPAGYHKSPRRPDTREWDIYYSGRFPLDTGKEPHTPGRIVRPGYPEYIQYGVNESPFDDAQVAQAAAEKLQQLEDPFFLYVGPLGPHDPYFVPQRFLDLYPLESISLPDNFEDPMEDKPALYRRTKDRYNQLTPEEHRESIRHFYAFCSYEDYLFGKVLEQVEQSGKIDNTLILYVSDHGDYVGAHGLWAKGLPCFREAYHVCSMIGGGLIENPGREEDALVSLADWYATFLELAGIPERKTSGFSLVPFLKNQPVENWRKECYTQSNGNEVYGIQRAVWNDKWKYVFNAFDYDELYDLEKDPGELHNLLHGISDFEIPASPWGPVVKEMWKKLWQFAKEHQDTCVNPYIMTAFAPYGPGILEED